MEKPQFEFYQRPNGHIEFQEFLASLNVKDQEKLVSVMLNTQKFGLLIAHKQKWVKSLGDGIFELRSEYAGNIQRGLYFHVEGSRYIITHGFTKKTQKTPPSQIKHAKDLRDEYFKED